jgi:zinc protease
MSRILLLAAALAVAAAVAPAVATAADGAAASLPGADQIVTRKLANGMTIVVWPDHDIPNVALYTWYRVGSRNEHPGITGISHYFEHMMFNGTSTRAPGEFDRTMEAAGGANNAYTSEDVTVYQDWFPRSALETIFDLEGDRMRNLAFDPKVVESERGVVYSERRTRVDDDGFGTLAEQITATAFVAHPYQFPVIGWPADIEGWKLQDLKDFYRTYYAPNNATMFVVGDVTPEEIFALAEKYIGPIPAQAAPEPVTTTEPVQAGERRIVVRKEGVTAPLLAMAWHAPAVAQRDALVMQVLLGLLADGESSRLHQRLVETDATAVATGDQLHKGFDAGLAWIYAVLPPGGDPAKVEAAIDEEIARIASEGPTAAELAKARKQARAAFWNGMQTLSGKAQALGTYETFHGDWRKLFDAPAQFDSITAADVQALAARVLVDDNRTLGTLLPTDAE